MKKKTTPKDRHTKLIGVWIFLMLLFIAELFAYAWCRVQWVRTGYEISQARNTQIRLKRMQHNLKVEIQRLKSPRRIAEIARKKLKLDMPTPNQVIIFP